MKLRPFVFFAIMAAALPSFAQRHRAVAPVPIAPADTAYLDAARSAAAWLQSLERRTSDGSINWPTSDDVTSTSIGIDAGAAGIGAFHLRLYQETGDSRYLDRAIGAGKTIAATYTRLPGPDWLSGRAGFGDYFLALYSATADARWLDEAKKAAASLISLAQGDADAAVWPNGSSTYTSLAHGGAGVGLFLLHLNDVAPDQQYVDTAMRAYRGMMKYTLPAGSGITLKRLTTDGTGYTGWCGGTVGAAIFLSELERVTGDAGVGAARRAALDGIVDAGIQQITAADEPLVFWRYDPSATRGGPPVIYCHGGAGNAALLANAWLATGDPRYRDTAIRGAKWLDSVAVPETAGRSWYHVDGGQLHELGFLTGTAAVGHGSLQFYRAFHRPEDLARAQQAADFLLMMAQHPAAGQSKWITRTDTVEVPRYDTGWYSGAAGIGLFMLELHDAVRGDIAPRPFSIFYP